MQELDHFLMDDVSSLFQRQEVIVVGYSGTDNHIMKDLFAKIPPSNAVYWCTYKDNPVPEQVDEIVSNGHLCPVTKMPKALSLMRGFSCLRYPTLGTPYCHGDSLFDTRVTFSTTTWPRYVAMRAKSSRGSKACQYAAHRPQPKRPSRRL